VSGECSATGGRVCSSNIALNIVDRDQEIPLGSIRHELF